MTTWLHRFTVKPHHLDAYLPLWRREVTLRRACGFTVHRAFVETDAEPKFTWLYSHPDADAPALVAAEAEASVLADAARPHVFGNVVVRPVDVEVLTCATPESMDGRIAIMRRYDLTGDWDGFLEVWRRIVGVRERHGFTCLFAVADRPHDLFTWAFDFAGEWADFPAAQRGYYADPDRVALRSVFDHMADYSIHPARQLVIDEEPANN
ncbi:MAG TPA: hypothetical protein PKX10_00010 [Propioniciclava tarda]|nr:hypothetical protein [Propioniciclava tarda]HQA29789.1 hypothetical protein [Propioniciclava tarda]HQD59794.1 hypothetical protein [Propioniciclava tarda]